MITLQYIQPGQPNQNGFTEQFNRTFRHEVLDAYAFDSLEQVQEISAEWLQSYKEERHQVTLDGIHPSTQSLLTSQGSVFTGTTTCSNCP